MSGIVGTSHSKSKIVGSSKDTANVHVRFNTSAGIDSSYNVSSMVDTGTGNWRINFSKPMVRTAYVCVTMTQLSVGTSQVHLSRVINQNLTYCEYNFLFNGALYDGDPNHCVIFGGG